jgi:hypothetical protein
MRWILVWWIIHPHYMEVKYLRGFESVESCFETGKQIYVPRYKVNFHCGVE